MWPVKEMPSRFMLFKEAKAAGRGQSTGAMLCKEHSNQGKLFKYSNKSKMLR